MARQCPFCGTIVAEEAASCYKCREALPDRVTIRGGAREGSAEMRRGFLYMVMAGVLFYFAAGYSEMEFPVEIPTWLPDILLPMLFLGGLGLVALGLFKRARG
jgi:hypothetical protein